MVIDCDRCEVRGLACGECVVGVLLGVPDVPRRVPSDPAPGRPSGAPVLQLDAPERRALDALADQGLVPPLRLVTRPARRATRDGHGGGTTRDVG